MLHASKAQSSLFILVGILLLFLALFFFKSEEQAVTDAAPDTSTSVDLSLAAKQAQTFMAGCLEQGLKEVVALVAERGGYFEMPEQSILFGGETSPLLLSIPYYQVNDSLFIPTGEDLQHAISSFLAPLFVNCSAAQKIDGYDIARGELALRVVLSNESVAATVNASTRVINLGTGEEKTISGVRAGIPSRISEALSIAQRVIDGNKQGICASCMAEQTPPDIELNTFESNQPPEYVVVYQLVYNETFGEDTVTPALFQFAAKYRSDSDSLIQRVHFINEDALANRLAVVGRKFEYRAMTNADAELLEARGVAFSDDTELFDIAAGGPDAGTISFTPIVNDIGLHLIELRLEEKEGAWDSTILTVEVTE